MSEIKILHLTWALGLGGAEEMLVDIANEQCRTDTVCIMVVNDAVDDVTRARIDPRVQLSLLKRKPGSRSGWPLLRLNWLLHQIRPDIIHAHSWTLAKLIPFCSYRILLTVHTTADADAAGNFDAVIGRYDAVFAISSAVASDLQKRTNRIQPKIVKNGIQSAKIRSRPRATDRMFRIVQVARLDHHYKGQDILLRAIARVRDEPGGELIRLDFVGEGESRQYLERMVRDLGLEKLVSFRGAVPRPTVYNELCAYDLLVQASRHEGFGLSVIEAMAAGVPVLISDLEAPKEIIEGGRFGLLFRPDDDADCAQQIQCVREMKIKNRATLIERLSAAREHVLEKFDVTRTAREYLREYREALGRGDRINELENVEARS